LPVPDAHESQLEITLWDLGEAAEEEDESFLGEVVLNVAKLLPFRDRLIEQVFDVKQGPVNSQATLTLRLLLAEEDGIEVCIYMHVCVLVCVCVCVCDIYI